MDVNVKEIIGVWKLGYSLDKHTTRSTPIGYNDFGHMQFETIRPEAGEALFQLKYRSDYSQAPLIANQLYISLSKYFSSCDLIVPMPPSNARPRQPVSEISRDLAKLMNIPCDENILLKNTATPPMKDIATREEKVSSLMGVFSINDVLAPGSYDVLIVDDLYDTGSSLEAATNILKGYSKIRDVYVATVTRKR